jgi:ABC-2 type transport system ATP-binding protein
VLFLDEPTTGLDPRSRLAMWEIIKNLLAGGTTILLTTQYLEEADQLADRIVVIDDGRVIAEGTPSALKSKVGNDRLELTFFDEASFSRALVELGEDVIDSNAKAFSATVVIIDTNSDVKRALDILAEAGIAVQALAVHKPTLDDVFLSLTGKQKAVEAVEIASR